MMNSNMTNHTKQWEWEKFGGLCGLTNSTGIALYITMLFLLAIVSTIGNLMILIVIFKNKIFQTPSLLLLGILAILDLFNGCVVTPIKASLTIEITSLRLVYVFHWLFIGYLFLTLSTMLLISLDRFLHVTLLDRYNFNKLKIAGALILWILPLAGMMLFRAAFVAVIFFFIYVVLIVLLHIGIIFGIQRHNLNHPHGDLMIQQKKAAKTARVIFITFGVMTVIPMLTIIFIMTGFFLLIEELCALTYFFMLAHSAVNPVIYCYRVPLMRDHIAKLIWKQPRDNETQPNNPQMSEEYVNGVYPDYYPDYANHVVDNARPFPQRVELGAIEEGSSDFQIEETFDDSLKDISTEKASAANPYEIDPTDTKVKSPDTFDKFESSDEGESQRKTPELTIRNPFDLEEESYKEAPKSPNPFETDSDDAEIELSNPFTKENINQKVDYSNPFANPDESPVGASTGNPFENSPFDELLVDPAVSTPAITVTDTTTGNVDIPVLKPN